MCLLAETFFASVTLLTCRLARRSDFPTRRRARRIVTVHGGVVCLLVGHFPLTRGRRHHTPAGSRPWVRGRVAQLLKRLRCRRERVWRCRSGLLTLERIYSDGAGNEGGPRS